MPAKNYVDPVKERYWREQFEKHALSGLSGMAYCTREGIKYGLFSDWLQRLRKRDQQPESMRAGQTVDWLAVIEKARAYPAGVVSYLREHGIDEKLYYRHFRELRKTHPEWTNLTRDGRKNGNHRITRSVRIASPLPGAQSDGPEFAPVRVLPDRIPVPTMLESNQIEIILSTGLRIRAATGSSVEFLSSLVKLLE